MSAHLFRELTTFFIAYISRRCTNKTRGWKLFSIFAHVNTNERVFRAKHKFRQGLYQVGLTNACRSNKHKSTNGTIRVFKPKSITCDGTCETMNGTVLGNNLTSKCLLHAFEANRFFFLHAFHRDTTHERNNTCYVCFIYSDAMFL